MLKKLAVLGAVLSFATLTLPPLASASSLTSQQISSIVSLIQSFGANSSTIANVQAALTGQPASTPSSCVSLTSDLYAGETDATTGGQVSQLQSFLNLTPTSYFGPLTEQAVQNYQSSHGIVSSGSPDTTGYGFVGPLTRQSMECGSSAGIPSGAGTPTATIDQNYLNTTSGTPTIMGTASGLSSVFVTVYGKAGETSGSYVVPATNGQWGTILYPKGAAAFTPGTYEVSVYSSISDPSNGVSPLTTALLTISAGIPSGAI